VRLSILSQAGPNGNSQLKLNPGILYSDWPYFPRAKFRILQSQGTEHSDYGKEPLFGILQLTLAPIRKTLAAIMLFRTLIPKVSPIGLTFTLATQKN